MWRPTPEAAPISRKRSSRVELMKSQCPTPKQASLAGRDWKLARDLKQDITIGDRNCIDADRNNRRKTNCLAGPNAKAASMEGTLDGIGVEITLSERSPAMSTGV